MRCRSGTNPRSTRRQLPISPPGLRKSLNGLVLDVRFAPESGNQSARLAYQPWPRADIPLVPRGTVKCTTDLQGQTCQDRPARTDLPGQTCKDRPARTDLQGQTCQDRPARTDLPGRT